MSGSLSILILIALWMKGILDLLCGGGRAFTRLIVNPVITSERVVILCEVSTEGRGGVKKVWLENIKLIGLTNHNFRLCKLSIYT